MFNNESINNMNQFKTLEFLKKDLNKFVRIEINL